MSNYSNEERTHTLVTATHREQEYRSRLAKMPACFFGLPTTRWEIQLVSDSYTRTGYARRQGFS